MSNCTANDNDSKGPGLGPSEVDRIMSMPEVRARLAEKPKIDRSYDMPWLAGYSTDAKTVFIDRHFPSRIKVGQRLINAIPFLVHHEVVEKAIIDTLGWKYPAAHEVAEQEEHRMLRAVLGLESKPYEAALKPYIKADASEKVLRVPANYDLQPFVDSHDYKMLMQLRYAMGGNGSGNLNRYFRRAG